MSAHREATIAKSPSKRVHPVQGRVLGVKAKHSHSQSIGPLLCGRTDSSRDEDQGLAPVRECDGRGPFHNLDIDVSSADIYPPQKAGTVEVANPTSITRSDHGFARTEVDHPSAAQLHGFGIVCAPAHRLGMQHVLVHGSRLHPTAEIAAMRVGTES